MNNNLQRTYVFSFCDLIDYSLTSKARQPNAWLIKKIIHKRAWNTKYAEKVPTPREKRVFSFVVLCLISKVFRDVTHPLEIVDGIFCRVLPILKKF